MSEKKNIDRLFQEKLKDFEVAPPEQSWEDISSRLPQSNKPRRVVPLWFRVSGVAAVLLLGLMFALPVFNQGNDTDTAPVVFEDNNGNNAQPDGNSTVNRNGNITKPGNAVTDNGTDASVSTVNNNSNLPGRMDNATTIGHQNNNGNITNPADKNNTVTTGSRHINKTGKPVYNNNTVAYENAKAPVIKPRSKVSNSIQEKTSVQDNSTGVAYSPKSGKHKSNKGNSKNNTITNTDNLSSNTTSTARQVAVNEQKIKEDKNNSNRQAEKYTSGRSIKNDAVAANNVQENNSGKTDENSSATVIDKGVIPTTGNINTETAVAEVAVDSVKKENELEKLAQQMKENQDKEEELAINDADKTRWKIKPQLAPVFYSSMTDGSPIDEQFAGNSKTYDNDLSYGLGINYALNNRFSIRTGINTVNLSYTTNNIQFYASMDQSTPNISTASGTTANLVVENQYGPSGDPTASLPIDDVPTPKYEGSMVQRMGYIEVPLEMSYKLVDKRFGIDIIGGISTLFLNRNNVSVVSAQGYRSELGEADNLNNLHFSTNIGVGFKYRFWKSFEASVEPIVKYQVNTFSNNPGNFRPYFVGLYSGISFSF